MPTSTFDFAMNMEKQEQSSLKLIRQVAGSFVDGLRRAMRVSSQDMEGVNRPGFRRGSVV